MAIDVITDRYLADLQRGHGDAGRAAPDACSRRATEHHGRDHRDDRPAGAHNGHAYAAEGHVLFNTQAYADYGKLSGRRWTT